MPSRIVRDRILSSESLASLSHPAERLFYRLVVLVDDHGRYHGSPQYVRHAAMALLDVSVPDVGRWLAELASADVVCIYEVGRRPYLQFKNWTRYQRLRAKSSKFPAHEGCVCGHPRTPADIGGQMRPESESETESESDSEDVIKRVSSFVTSEPENGKDTRLANPQGRRRRTSAELLVEEIVEFTEDSTERSIVFYVKCVRELGEDPVRGILSTVRQADNVGSRARMFTSLASKAIERTREQAKTSRTRH